MERRNFLKTVAGLLAGASVAKALPEPRSEELSLPWTSESAAREIPVPHGRRWVEVSFTLEGGAPVMPGDYIHVTNPYGAPPIQFRVTETVVRSEYGGVWMDVEAIATDFSREEKPVAKYDLRQVARGEIRQYYDAPYMGFDYGREIQPSAFNLHP